MSSETDAFRVLWVMWGFLDSLGWIKDVLEREARGEVFLGYPLFGEMDDPVQVASFVKIRRASILSDTYCGFLDELED